MDPSVDYFLDRLTPGVSRKAKSSTCFLLPSELLLDVFLHLRDDKKQLKLLRHVCKSWSHIACIPLFHKAVISPHHANIAVLGFILRDATLSRYVKELEYDAASFIDLRTDQEYLNELHASHYGSVTYNHEQAKVTRRHYLRCFFNLDGPALYRNHYREQEQLLPRIPRLLIECLNNFKNLKKITIRSSWIVNYDERRNFLGFKGPGIVARTWPLRVLGPRQLELSSAMSSGTDWPLMVVASALQEANVFIDRLFYDELWSSSTVLDSALRTNPQDDLQPEFEALLRLFKGLKVAQLVLPGQLNTTPPRDPRSKSALVKLLGAGRNLTNLYLGFWGRNTGRGCLQDLHFPALRDFRMTGGVIHQKELTSFLMHHRTILRTLIFSRLTLCGSWADLFDVLRENMHSLCMFGLIQFPFEAHFDGTAHVVIQILPGKLWKCRNVQRIKQVQNEVGFAGAKYVCDLDSDNWLRDPDLVVLYPAAKRFIIPWRRTKAVRGLEAAHILQLPASDF